MDKISAEGQAHQLVMRVIEYFQTNAVPKACYVAVEGQEAVFGNRRSGERHNDSTGTVRGSIFHSCLRI